MGGNSEGTEIQFVFSFWAWWNTRPPPLPPLATPSNRVSICQISALIAPLARHGR